MNPRLAVLALSVLVASVAAGAQERPADPGISSEISVTVVEIPVTTLKTDEPMRSRASGRGSARLPPWDFLRCGLRPRSHGTVAA